MAHLLYIRASFHQHMKEREEQADSLSSLSLSLSACVIIYVCTHVYARVSFGSYSSSEMIQDETWLPRNVNDPELSPYMNRPRCLNYFAVIFMDFSVFLCIQTVA